jgi:hypothetical protein
MTRDWKLVAKGLNLQIPEPDLEKIQATLQGLEVQFASLIKALPHETEPATIFPCSEEERS